MEKFRADLDTLMTGLKSKKVHKVQTEEKILKEIGNIGTQDSMERMQSVMQLFRKTMNGSSPESNAMLVEDNNQ